MMKIRTLFLLLAISAPLIAQDTKPQSKPMPHPAKMQAPGGGPDKVWVNTGSMVYHCPGDRYYGKTKAGKYMTEKDARAAGAHGEKGQTCFK
jgi:hypothetical protein